ncbi:UMP kinase [Alkalispirochaeta alkalica]|uniref:UMP kinase n=1 Tax=Alkalispirochaeta alkalica TaxID=46356 RepID=UPI00037CE39D|nr:UMP kinase [Alkalispirochaeta alkalica]
MFVISLGGSILVPDQIDTSFLASFRTILEEHLQDPTQRVVLVIGGGGPARRYQEAYRSLTATPDPDAQDWIGIMATRLNAELVRQALAPHCCDPVVYDPTAEAPFTGRILVAAGWKPGFSTDFDAVKLAERFGADTVVNLSNIAQVYTADPKEDPSATPLERVTWEEFRRIVGDHWTPGKNLPFDPVATRRAAELGLRVIAADGKNLENTRAILAGEEFFGTRIGP